MKYSFLSTAISGVFDAFRGILTTGRDAACHVSTLMCVALCAATITAYSQSGRAGNLSWSIANGTLTISGTGVMPNYPSKETPWYTFHTSIRTIIINDGVTTIGNDAFSNLSSLTKARIPNSVKSIGESAFRYCFSLTEVTIPNSVTSIGKYAFEYCTSLTEVTIPNSVTSIEHSAFSSCHSLREVRIPNSVTSIGITGTFGDCISLTAINVDAGNNNFSSIDGVLFNKNKTTLIRYPGGKQGGYAIPNLVTSIGDHAFSGCSSLTKVTIPNSVTSIGELAFLGCSSLTEVTIPNSVTSIRDYAFWKCSSLIKVTIPNSVTSIGWSAFDGCSSLTELIIPNSVTSIRDYAFSECSSLTSIINYATTPQVITSGVFKNVTPSNIRLRVPAGSVAAYKAHSVWGKFDVKPL